MTIKKILFTFGFIVCTCVFLEAQIQLMTSDATADKGQVVDIDIIISGFSGIVGMQFSINWDSTILVFKEVNNLTEQLPQFTEDEIGLAEVESGAIRVVWIDNSVSGVNLEDSTLLFTLKFEVIGEHGAISPIRFSNQPIAIEFIDTEGEVQMGIELIDGEVKIPDNTTPVLVQEVANRVQLFQNDPNPFHSTTKIIARFFNSERTQFYISTIGGKIIYRTSFKPIPGINTIEIGRSILKTPGIYFYTLQGEKYQLSKKMILLP